MKTRVTVLALVLSLPALAQDQNQKTTGDYVKKALESNTSKNVQAQALSKVGMDFTPAPAGARVYFIEPKNGATVSSPVKVLFGLSGMGVAPAGTQKEHTGHHHVLIDGPKVDMNAPLPATEQVLHFGGGQTEAAITLKPGRHTLQLVLGDWKHQPHAPPVASETITITVK
jgi:hypothetical protein